MLGHEVPKREDVGQILAVRSHWLGPPGKGVASAQTVPQIRKAPHPGAVRYLLPSQLITKFWKGHSKGILIRERTVHLVLHRFTSQHRFGE